MIEKPGVPAELSASTRTTYPSIPNIAAEKASDSISRSLCAQTPQRQEESASTDGNAARHALDAPRLGDYRRVARRNVRSGDRAGAPRWPQHHGVLRRGPSSAVVAHRRV